MVQPQHSHRAPLRSVLEAYVNVTAVSYTAKAGNRVIGVNRAGVVTLTLPTAEVRKGRVYTVKDESAAATTSNITVATEGAETIDGSATGAIADNYGSITYCSDGSNWFTIPLLPAAAHTLASHSAKAHSDLSDAPAAAHHTKYLDSEAVTAVAGIVKLDDLAAPDDNTDLDVSTSLHGLVPKGANVGNFLKDNGTWAAPGGGGIGDHEARAYHNASQSISNASATILSLNSERWDTDAYHDNATNNSRLTVPSGQGGTYIISAQASFAFHATGYRRMDVVLNGSTLIFRAQYAPTTDEAGMLGIAIYQLVATNYIEMRVYQNSGGALNIISQANSTPEFAMQRVA